MVNVFDFGMVLAEPLPCHLGFDVPRLVIVRGVYLRCFLPHSKIIG
jgi:hypothetical protein